MKGKRMKAVPESRRGIHGRASRIGLVALASLGCTVLPVSGNAANPPHPNPTAEQDEATVLNRGDVVHLPAPLKRVLGELAEESHTYLPLQVFAEADKPSQLFQYYLLDTTGFQPNVFTAIIPGINDSAIPTAANAANGQRPTFGAVRLALEPNPVCRPTPPTVGPSSMSSRTSPDSLSSTMNPAGTRAG